MSSDRKSLLESCRKRLNGHYPQSIQKSLLELVNFVDPHQMADAYGNGEVVQSLERKVATLLGKEAALFFPSGTMAQQIALRCWADRSGNNNVALHVTSHLELHEEGGYQILHPLRGLIAGDYRVPFYLQDLSGIDDAFGSAVLELPQRHSGGALPEWDELVAISAWCKQNQVKLHMDGARLWESTGYYQRSHSEISALFDSVYVSFYKGLGANGGAVLAGPADLIRQAAIWQRRHGGNLFNLYPVALSAARGLEARLTKFPEYLEKARAVGKIIEGLSHITAAPAVPQTNMMHLSFKGSVEAVEEALLQNSVETGIYIGNRLWRRSFSEVAVLELYIGDGALDLSNGDIAAVLSALNAKVKHAEG